MEDKKEFICFVANQKFYRHATLDAAWTEANRLSEQVGRRIYVLEMLGNVKVDKKNKTL